MRLAHQATAVFNGHISFRPHTAHCWLTLCSTGHFAAVGLWPSFHSRPKPNLRKTPVSSNVSHHAARICKIHMPSEGPPQMPRSVQFLQKTSQCGLKPQDLPKASERLDLKSGNDRAASRSSEIAEDIKCLSGTPKAVLGAPRKLTEMNLSSVGGQAHIHHRSSQVCANHSFGS